MRRSSAPAGRGTNVNGVCGATDATSTRRSLLARRRSMPHRRTRQRTPGAQRRARRPGDAAGSSNRYLKAKGRNGSHRCTPLRGARGRPRRDMEAVLDARFEGRSSRRSLRRSRAHARVRGRPVCGVCAARTRRWPLAVHVEQSVCRARRVVDGDASAGRCSCGLEGASAMGQRWWWPTRIPSPSEPATSRMLTLAMYRWGSAARSSRSRRERGR